MDEAKFRAAIAAEIWTFAKRVDGLKLADRREPEKPIIEKVALAQEMRRRADQLVREMAPPEGGLALAKVVFGNTGRVAHVERGSIPVRAPHTRRAGRLGLNLAA